jgi:hypothetical protein
MGLPRLLLAWVLAAAPALAVAQLHRCLEEDRVVYRSAPCVGQPPTPEVAAATEVALLEGAVRVVVPAGYTRMRAEEIAAKFGRTARPPFAAFADAKRNATIAFTLTPQKQPLTEEQLPEFLDVMEKMFPRLMPGLVWHRREVVSIAGRAWARLQLSAHALDTDVHNDMYFTPLRGDVLGVNLNATVAAWPAAEPQLAQAFRTIRVQR